MTKERGGNNTIPLTFEGAGETAKSVAFSDVTFMTDIDDSSARLTQGFFHQSSNILHSSSTINDESSSRRSYSPDSSGCNLLQIVLKERNLHGRVDELLQIHACFQSVLKNEAAELLFVSGVSGSGKSSLVEAVRPFVTITDIDGYFCAGKFDQPLQSGCSSEPFGAFSAAFSEAIDFITMDQEATKARCNVIHEKLGSEGISTLMRFVSNLSQLSNTNDCEVSRELQMQAHAPSPSSVHLPTLFRTFLQCLATKAHPIFMVLDDLQWADSDSIEVFRALATDPSLKHVLIVGIYRNDEITAEDILLPSSSSAEIPTTHLTIENLDLDGVNCMTMEKLNIDDPATTTPLSKAVLKKSGGNPFYVRQFMNNLYETGLLKYNEKEESWTWDDEAILAETNVSENVLELVADRIHRLPTELASLLMLLSHVGYRFDVDLIHFIVSALAGECSTPAAHVLNTEVVSLLQLHAYSQDSNLISKSLKRVIEEGLVEACSSTLYKFTHDRIQQVLYGMIESEELSTKVHYAIGKAALLFMDSSNESTQIDTSIVFIVTDQLNRAICFIKTEEEIIRLAKLNLLAAKTAASRSAYSSAASYLRVGVELLEDGRYADQNYELILDLWSSLAEMEVKTAKYESARGCCEKVLSSIARTVEDKLRTMVCLLESYKCEEGQLEKAVQTGIEFAGQIGIKTLRKPRMVHVIASFVRTNIRMHGVSDEDIMNLPRISDSTMEYTIEIITSYCQAAFSMTNGGNFLALGILHTVRLTMKYGMCDWSANAFAGLALLHSATGNKTLARRYGHLALKIMRKTNAPAPQPQTLLTVSHFVLPWEKSLSLIMENFVEGARTGQMLGDFENALLCASGVLNIMLNCGYNLQDALHFTRESCRELWEYGSGSAGLLLLLPVPQLMENLAGENPMGHTFKLTGEIMDEDEVIRTSEEQKNEFMIFSMLYTRLIGAVFFCQWDLVAELEPDARRLLHVANGLVASFITPFYLGLANAENFHRRVGRRRTNLRRLQSIIKKLRKWVNGEADNCKPLMLILEAELSVIQRPTQTEANVGLYQLALEECQRQELLHLEALANERAALACRRSGGHESTTNYMNAAMECYTEWGAEAKVMQIHCAIGRF